MENFSKTELENEKWKDIDGYDGMYQVSDLGRVRSKKYGDWRMTKLCSSTNDYLFVTLWKDGKEKNCKIHRLVAQAFIENTDSSKTIINHIDENKQNNRVDNLEYCTSQYNNTYRDIQFRKKNSVRRKVKDLYNPNLSYAENLDIFRAHGVECSKMVIQSIRKDLGLTKQYNKK